jgi:hypothetical protein
MLDSQFRGDGHHLLHFPFQPQLLNSVQMLKSRTSESELPTFETNLILETEKNQAQT